MRLFPSCIPTKYVWGASYLIHFWQPFNFWRDPGFEDIFTNQPEGLKLSKFKTPQILKVFCDESPDDPDYAPPPEERPEGYDWVAGGGANPGAENNHNDNDDQNIGDNNNVLHNDENQNLQEMPPQNNNGVLCNKT